MEKLCRAAGSYWKQNPQGINALIPEEWQKDFMEEITLRKKCLEQRLQEETEVQFARIHPSFQDKQLAEHLLALEMEIQKLSVAGVKRLFSFISVRYHRITGPQLQDIHKFTAMRIPTSKSSMPPPSIQIMFNILFVLFPNILDSTI